MLNQIIQRIREEPVLVKTTAAAVIGLLIAFGIPITAEQSAAVIGLLVIVTALIVRHDVTPVKKLRRQQEERLEQQAEADVEALTTPAEDPRRGLISEHDWPAE